MEIIIPRRLLTWTGDSLASFRESVPMPPYLGKHALQSHLPAMPRARSAEPILLLAQELAVLHLQELRNTVRIRFPWLRHWFRPNRFDNPGSLPLTKRQYLILRYV